MKKNRIVWMVFISVALLMGACHSSKKEEVFFPPIRPSKEHVLMALNPSLAVKTADIAINKEYLYLSTGKRFPVVGFLRVDDKLYRFMGGDYLRNLPLVTLSNDSCGWKGKYTFLRPDSGWKQEQYDGRMV